jgi:hypothetical protein
VLAGGTTPKPEPEEVEEMFVISDTCPAGESRDDYGILQVGLPYGRKTARVDLYVDCDPKDGVSAWACRNLDGQNQGLWSNGKDWELWIPGRKRTSVEVPNSAWGIQVRHMGGTKAALLVTVSGT